MHPATLQALHP